MICTSCAEPNAEAAELYLRNVSSRISACKTFALPSWYLVALTRQAGDPTTLRSDSHSLPTNGVDNRTNPPNAKYPQCLQHKWSEPFHSSPCCRHADHLYRPLDTGAVSGGRVSGTVLVLGSTSSSLDHLTKRNIPRVSHQ